MTKIAPNNAFLLKTFSYAGSVSQSLLWIVLMMVTLQLFSAPRPTPIVTVGKSGKLIYKSDSNGNRVIDFSYCGYQASEKAIPAIQAKVFVPLVDGDATELVQRAIDYVGNLPVDKAGFRGAIEFDAGTYRIAGRLLMNKSGVILRGKGMNEGGTVLLADGKDRATFIQILGDDNKLFGDPSDIKDAYVPVNANYVTVANSTNFKVGDALFIHRFASKLWNTTLGMDEMGGEETGYLGWKEGQRDIWWDRTITKIVADTLYFDAPITTALDTTFGVSQVVTYKWRGRIDNIGIENMALQSVYDLSNPKDEDHCHTAITVENAENIWVRQLQFTHFAGSAVAVFETARKVTVQDCMSLAPISEIANWRRNTFFTMGQQTLFQRLYAEKGYHDFATGFCAAGPNAFVQCESSQPYSFSGAIDSWASGLLFDIVNVDGQMLSFNNRYNDNRGAGWCAANSMFWQCSASRIENFAPPTATNWCFGSWGQFVGNGYWHEQNSHISPRSLYYKQLADRLGTDEKEYAKLVMDKPSEASSSPSIEQADELSKLAFLPLLQMKEWVMQAPLRDKILTDASGAISALKLKKEKTTETVVAPLHIENGWITQGDKVISGMRQTVPWWRGNPRPFQVAKESPAITRYVPGRYGKGYTDNLSEVIDYMTENNVVGLEHNYGLWYDRRRDDHERIRRMAPESWAPFYVQPFARSGQGHAWDQLSKYDLTKYDYFYWSRLKQFADLADASGKFLVHHNYFQHNILEAGAHWADSPWRPANNINNTDFPDPPPYAGDKRIFIAEQFYDITNPARRELHRQFIRQCLSNFADNNSVLQLISAEFTGPLHFVEFWLDVIAEWEKESGKHAMIGLSTTKDVQDAILNQPKRAAVIDVIDVRYWSYRPDGSCYQPKGGLQLAPRQHARLEKTGSRSFNSVYRNIIEYKTQFPEKAVIFSEGRFDQFGWAVFMAGGSLPVLPADISCEFMTSASTMLPVAGATNAEELSVLANRNGEQIVFLSAQKSYTIDLTNFKGTYLLRYIDPKTGKIVGDKKQIKGGENIDLSNPFDGKRIIWITKK